jgi:hypothetical protein
MQPQNFRAPDLSQIILSLIFAKTAGTALWFRFSIGVIHVEISRDGCYFKM